MTNIHLLQQFFEQYNTSIPELFELDSKLRHLQKEIPFEMSKLISLYDEIYPLLEKKLWTVDDFDDLLETYQGLFREQEALIEQLASNDRYSFILSIPIADRPEHLRGCLESIFQLCTLYSYGGYSAPDKGAAYFNKVIVVIVEDSKEEKHIAKDIELADEYTKKGLRVYHYGLEEQYELMLKIPEDIRQGVSSIIGEPSTENFYHKGQAITRNLSYLKALQLTSLDEMPDKENTLFYLVDSDQQFRVNRITPDGDQYVYGLNYFYYINRLFNEKNISILTGKLICDPPVSPSVMSGNFLDDIVAFFQQISEYDAKQECQFHPKSKIKPDDAAYHDMAHLFGLGTLRKTYDYCCPISSKQSHDHVACLKAFAERINYFFFGEHLTRKTYFSYSGPFTDIVPARTIYPGNYISNFEGLKYIIPFGKLRLRMSGPTAGRLIQSEIKEGFASVNLPMLHARTLQSDFKDEYRPGVEDKLDYIDLSDEFERQFFGDLMLFSVVKLSQSGVSIKDLEQTALSQIFADVETELLDLYEKKHNNVLKKCAILSALVDDKAFWWNQSDELNASIQQVHDFINNIQFNFDEKSKAYQQIQSKQNRKQRIEQMIACLLSYPKDRNSWDEMISLYNSYS